MRSNDVEVQYYVYCGGKIKIWLEMDCQKVFVAGPGHMIAETQIGVNCKIHADVSKVVDWVNKRGVES